MHPLGAKRRISGGVTMNSTSTRPAASPAASLDAFHLPLISLDSTTLTLMSCNTSASRVLGDAALRVGSTTAVDLLSKQPQPGWQNEMRSLLDDLVQTTVKKTGDSYGHGTPLQLWTTGKDGQRLSYSAEVLCVLNRSPTIPDSSTYDILLLRNISTEYRAFTTADDGSNSAPSDSGRASTRSIRSRSIGGGDGDLEPEVLSKFDEVFRRVSEKTEATARIGGGLDLPEHDLVKVLDAFPTIAFVADAAGSTEFWTRRWFEYTGVSPDPATWVGAFHPSELAGSVAHWTGEVAKGAAGRAHWQYRIKSKEGTWRWFLCEGRPIVSGGQAVRWVATITDVQDLVQVKEEALRSQELFAAVMTSSQTMLFTIDRDSMITFFSGIFRASIDPSTMVGSPLDIVCPHSHLADGCCRILDEDLDLLVVECETSDDSSAIMEYSLAPLTNSSGEKIGVIVVGSDVTESRRTAAALRQSQLERADLLASEHAAKEASKAVSSFYSRLSHELRTPVAGIIGLCELLLDDPTLQPEARKMVDKALRTGQILLDLVGLVLDMGKIEADKMTIEASEFDLTSVVDDVRMFSVLAAKNGVEFVEDFDSGDWYDGPLLGDAMRLRQVLTNAISNSIKFTKEGSVILRFRQDQETAEKVDVSFIIKDTGIGIAPDVLPTLFTPFTQADSSTAREFGGTGLGLVLIKSLVELMGGSILLESESGVGSTMTVKLSFTKANVLSLGHPSTSLSAVASPRIPSPRPSTSRQRANGAAGGHNADTVEVLNEEERRARSSGVKILLAEDNELIREIVTRTLHKLGYAVDAVPDGVEAVAAVQRGDYNLVLMDGQMPRMDGYMATRRIRQLESDKANLPVIALTASAIVGDREKCLEAGMSSYLSKPVRARDLDLKIWEQLVLAEKDREKSGS